MASIQDDELSEIIKDEIMIKKEEPKRVEISKKKKNHFFAYLYLFAFVFLGALWGLSMVIKSYTPQIDVSIDNNEQLSFLNSDSINTETKSVDERLKYIQMEDDLPSVSILSSEKAEKERVKSLDTQKNEFREDSIDDNIRKQNKIEYERNQKREEQAAKIEPAKPVEIEITKEIAARKEALKKEDLTEDKIQIDDFKSIPAKEIVPMPKPLITKVYLGNYSTREDAQKVQEKIVSIEPNIAPFIKSVNNYYIVQIGSFSDSERAGVLVEKLRKSGYYPKIKYEN